MSDRDQYEHARGNAKGWYETIRDLYREELTLDDDFNRAHQNRRAEIQTAIDEGPLSVLVRSGWHSPDAAPDDPANSEYELLLSTGGPALRIWGELDGLSEPENARLEMQDWGVPWREVWPCEVEEMDECRAALLWYAGHFYFGE